MNPKPYHNPEKVDESCVPDGWRFLYADEAGKAQDKPCRVWFPYSLLRNSFGVCRKCRGNRLFLTYIVPVNA